MTESRARTERCWALIIPDEIERRSFISDSRFLVHYTNHITGILGASEFRMRNARNMKSDSEEIHFGQKCVNDFLRTRSKELRTSMNSIFEGAFDELYSVWESEFQAQRSMTFVSCFTSHSIDSSGSECHFKRFGAAAIFIDPRFMLDEPSILALNLCKVRYGEEKVLENLERLLDNLNRFGKDFQKLDRGIFISLVRHQLFLQSIATKSDLFAQEDEWRIVHSPNIFSSAHVQPEQRSFGSKDNEEVYALRMERPMGTDKVGLEPANLIRKILIHKEQANFQDLRREVCSQLMYLRVNAPVEIVGLPN